MTLTLEGYLELPAHVRPGGFDHAAVHGRTARLYVAHTCNDAVDVIDCAEDRYLSSIPGLGGVAGVLLAEDQDLMFTSNRAEDTAGIVPLGNQTEATKVPVGVRPNGLAYAPGRRWLLVANVGDPQQPGSAGVTLVDVARQVRLGDLSLPGRTRWSVYDAATEAFYVNIADPALIAVVEARTPLTVARTLAIPAAGPHGLDLDADGRRLFCACDAGRLVSIDLRTGAVDDVLALGGAPDVIFYNPALRHLYVALGDPGCIEVIDTQSWRRIATVPTEAGAHTLAFDARRNRVYAFLPLTHRAAVFVDRGPARRRPGQTCRTHTPD
jgi:DNA-binding beta-propeller fold protein YncE